MSEMASAHDRAVLQAIFNPTTPFGDIPGLNREEDLTDDGESELLFCVPIYYARALKFAISLRMKFILKYLRMFHSWLGRGGVTL